MALAHSRGAVATILLTHELYRIQTQLKQYHAKQSTHADSSSSSSAGLTAWFMQLITNSPCSLTKYALEQCLESGSWNINEQQLTENIDKLQMRLFLIDPVPGGQYMWVSGVAWHDERFYLLPPIVKKVEQFLYLNERSRCFKAIVPKAMDTSLTQCHVYALPGHHGTGSGNLYTQQYTKSVSVDGKEQVIDAKTTALVQRLLVFKALSFLKRHGAEFKSLRGLSPHPLNEFFQAFCQESNPDKLIEQCYDLIHANRRVFELFNHTSYAWLGQEQSLLSFFTTPANSRLIHYHQHNDTPLTMVCDVNRDLVVNAEHLGLKLAKWFPELHEQSQPDKVLNDFSLHLNQALLLIGSDDADKNLLTKFLIDATEKDLKLIDSAIKNLLSNVSQMYLRNHLTVTQRIALFAAVKNLYTRLNVRCDDAKGRHLITRFTRLINSQLIQSVGMQFNLIEQGVTRATQYHLGISQKQAFKQKFADIIDEIHFSIAKENNHWLSKVLREQVTRYYNQLSLSAFQPSYDSLILFLQALFKQLNAITTHEVDVKKLAAAVTPSEQDYNKWQLSLQRNHAEQMDQTYGACRDMIAALRQFESIPFIVNGIGSVDESFNFKSLLVQLNQWQILLVNYAQAYLKEHPGYQFGDSQLQPLASEVLILKQRLEDHQQQLKSREQEVQHLNSRVSYFQSQLQSTRSNSQRTVNELREASRLASEEHHRAHEKAAAVNSELQRQLEEVVAAEKASVLERQQQIHWLTDKDQIRCNTVITEYLLPKTNLYLRHLQEEIDNSEAPCDLLLSKIELVKGLKTILQGDAPEVGLEPKKRVTEFVNQLTAEDNQLVLTRSRGEAYKHYVVGSLLVVASLLTGIIPGIAAAIYAYNTPDSRLRFWQASGKNYTEQCQQLTEQLSPSLQ